MNNANRDYRMCILRIVATLSVILLHTASALADNSDIFSINSGQKIFLTFMHHIMFWAVPVFFMLTGRLLLDKERNISYKKAITKYSLRPILALILFSFPFACIKIYIETNALDIMIIPKALSAVLANESFPHFWYLYELIGIYLLLPVIKSFINTVGNKSIDIFLGLLFIANFIFPFIEGIFSINLALKMLIPYSVFYLILGYRLSISKKSVKGCYLILGIILVVALILISEFLNFSIYIINYKSPVIAILSVCIYMLFNKIKIDRLESKKLNIIWNIDRLCFGAYLIHPLFIQITYRYLNIVPTNYNFYGILFFILFVTFSIVSFGTSLVLYKIKPLKKYVL